MSATENFYKEFTLKLIHLTGVTSFKVKEKLFVVTNASVDWDVLTVASVKALFPFILTISMNT